MKDKIKQFQLLILNSFFGILILPLLFIITMVNIENIYQFNGLNFYTVGYFLYFFVGVIGLLLYRFKKINNNLIREEVLYTLKSIFFLTFFLLPVLYINHNFIFEHINQSNLYLRSYGRIAFLFLTLALSISPILRFVKKQRIIDNLILSRKIFGILAFVFFLKHGLEYFALEYIFQVDYHSNISYLEYVYKNMLVRYDALSGVVVGILMLLLGITSNKISVKILGGRKWKTIQSLVFPVFLLSIIHIAFASRFDNFYIVLAIFLVILRSISYITYTKNKTEGKTTKYRCIPCGYIYNESLGDPDSGIEPGTKFEDIPDDWYCPVCGVTKADFEPYYEGDDTVFGGYMGEVINTNMLTDDVLELSLSVNKRLTVKKGQYAILKLKDFDGEFSRAYSIVSYKDNVLTFGIKLKDTGRGGRILKKYKIGDSIKINGIYGEFILKDTESPKVFIATGTGLSPLMNMISGKLKSSENHLFFGVQAEKDLFYIDKIKSNINIKSHIYLSREEAKGYENGRIDLSKYKFDKNTEFYICGNPGLVKSTFEFLNNNGYKNIYSEKF